MLSHHTDAAYTARAWSNALRTAYYVARSSPRIVLCQPFGFQQISAATAYADNFIFAADYVPAAEGEHYAHDEVNFVGCHFTYAAVSPRTVGQVHHRVTVDDGTTTAQATATTFVSPGRAATGYNPGIPGAQSEAERRNPLFERIFVDVSSLTADQTWHVLYEVYGTDGANELFVWPLSCVAYWETRG